jgi:hypothetical protein
LLSKAMKRAQDGTGIDRSSMRRVLGTPSTRDHAPAIFAFTSLGPTSNSSREGVVRERGVKYKRLGLADGQAPDGRQRLGGHVAGLVSIRVLGLVGP